MREVFWGVLISDNGKLDFSCVMIVSGGATGDETSVSILRGVPLGGDTSRSKTDDSWFTEGVGMERAYMVRGN